MPAWELPRRPRARAVLVAGAWLGLALLFLPVDPALMDRIQAFARAVTADTGKMPDWLGYPLEWWAQLPGILGLAAFAWWRSGRAARAVAVVMVVSLAGLANGAVKLAAGRIRPSDAYRAHGSYATHFYGPARGFEDPDYRSFPSGHTAAAAANTASLAVFHPTLLPLGIALSAGVASERVFHEKHYLSDIAGAVAIGWSVGMALLAAPGFRRLCERIEGVLRLGPGSESG
jgi:membrane-associated phospholipid phosphatase